MNIERDKLFKFIKKKLPENVLFVEEIADVLNISYDASYRRINGKTSLSFKEALLLAKCYKISLNDLYDLSNNLTNKIIENNYIDPSKSIIDFYKDVSSYIDSYASDENAKVFYVAKDIPTYHTPVDTLYNKFRVYVYLNFLSKPGKSKIEPFNEFVKKELFSFEAKRFKEVFKNVSVTEIWNDMTINSCLHTIFYFYKTKDISREEALLLCDDIFSIIETIEVKAKTKIWDKDKGTKYEFYYNKLVNVNHMLFLKSNLKKGLLIPYSYLSYMKIEDKVICDEVEIYLERQLQFSKRMSGEAEVERRMFFTEMYEKIEQLKKQIETETMMSFM